VLAGACSCSRGQHGQSPKGVGLHFSRARVTAEPTRLFVIFPRSQLTLLPQSFSINSIYTFILYTQDTSTLHLYFPLNRPEAQWKRFPKPFSICKALAKGCVAHLSWPDSVWSTVPLLCLEEKGYGEDEYILKHVDISESTIPFQEWPS
jgi:hypothetical protein